MPAAVDSPSRSGIGKIFRSSRRGTAKDSDANSSSTPSEKRSSLDGSTDRLRSHSRRSSDELSDHGGVRNSSSARKLSKFLRLGKDSGDSPLSLSQSLSLSRSRSEDDGKPAAHDVEPDVVLEDNASGSLLTDDEEDA